MTQEERCFIEKLYVENFDKLYHYANIILKDSGIAENIVNDTFVEAMKKAHILAIHEKPVGWLIQALKFNIKNYQRAQSKRAKTVPLETVDEQLAAKTNLEEDLLDYTNALTDEDRRLVELYYKKGYTHKELSKEFGISVSASQKRLERIRHQLKRAMIEK